MTWNLEPCADCARMRRSGGLPCYYRSDIDILTMAADQPQVKIISCPHYQIPNDPADLIEWIS